MCQTLGHGKVPLVTYIHYLRGLRSAIDDLKPRQYYIYALGARTPWPKVWQADKASPEREGSARTKAGSLTLLPRKQDFSWTHGSR